MKFWVYINGEVPGCFTPAELARLPGFTATALVCPAEGEILEKNWRRAGEFPEIMPLLQELSRREQPAPPPEPPAALDVEKQLDTAGNRLFSHVADLMKELETRREEKGMVLSLQRQIMDLKEQLQQARENAAELENRMPRITELEEAARKNAERIQALESSLAARDRGITEMRVDMEKARSEAESAKRKFGEANNDLAIRNRLVEKLSRDLTEKEVNLAKALGLIRRLEENLNRICPDLRSGDEKKVSESKPAEAAPPPLPTPIVEPKIEAIPEAADAALPDRPKAQTALVDFLKKIVNRPEV
jgi:hypothetical protein